MNELTVWLRAQLDEDERVAGAARETRGLVWFEGDSQVEVDAAGAYREQFPPDRALREVEAKRLRLAEVERDLADDPTDETAAWLLRVEALPYADRPGFDESWRP